jgi:acetyl esterase/lipase
MTVQAFSQDKYQLKENISYRSGELTPYQSERCKIDLYHPSKKGFATVVWFHGGGLKAGKKEIPKELLEQGLAVVAVNYRLSPKVKVKDCIEDAAAAVAWVLKNIEKFGGHAHKVFVSGHSAGGYLTSMVGLDKSYLGKYKVDANSIAGLIPFSGHAITHFTRRKEMGISGKQALIDDMAPLFHIRKDAPPYIIITGDRELEMLGRYEENAYMMRMMKVNGHKETYLYEIDGHGHGPMVKPAFHILLKYVRSLSKKK